MKLQVIFSIGLLILSRPVTCWTQNDVSHLSESDLKVESITLPGLGNDIIIDEIVQDSFGFLWIATGDGLIRYDGHQVIRFLHDPGDSSSISGNDLSALYFDGKGHLWVGNYHDKGLNKMDLKSGKFTHYLPGVTVWAITGDSKGNLWIGTYCSGLYKLDPVTDSITHFEPKPGDTNSLRFPSVFTIIEDREGNIWIGSGADAQGALCHYLPESDKFIYYPPTGQPQSQFSLGLVTTLLEDSQGTLWVGTANGRIFTVNHNNHRLDPLSLDHPWNDTSWVCHIFEDYDRNIWFGTLNGLFRLDPKSNQQTHFGLQVPSYKIPSNIVWSLFQSMDSVLWVGTGRNGRLFFKMYRDHPLIEKSTIEELTIYSMVENNTTGRQEIWAGSNDGLLLYDLRKGMQKHYPQSLFSKLTTPAIIHSLRQDSEGNLWAAVISHDASENIGLLYFNVEKEAFELYSLPSSKPGIDWPLTPIMDILVDRSGFIWIATHELGLFRFDPKSRQFQPYLNSPDTLSGNYIVDLIEDRSGAIWILGYQKGALQPAGYGVKFLDRFEPIKGKLTHIPLPEIINRKSTRMFQKLFEDLSGNIWIQGSDEGFISIDQKGNILDILKPSNSELLSFDIMATIHERGQFWIKDRNQIYRLDPTSHKISSPIISYQDSTQNFGRFFFHDGIRMQDGTLIFGTEDGIIKIGKDRMEIADSSQISFSSLTIISRQVNQLNIDKNILDGSRIQTLSHKENTFSIHFFIPDFRKPDENRYEYIMEDYDASWRETTHTPEALYINLKPGKYKFRVRAKGYHESLIASGSIFLHILPPWYWAWWSKSLYLLLLCSSIYWFYQFQLKRELAISEADRLKELDTFKSRLYTNITHEFRTPLTIILGIADQLLDQVTESGKQGVGMIRRNGNRLLNLVNQLLDMQKLEAGALPIHLIQSDIVLYLKYLVESFQSYAESKSIHLFFKSHQDVLFVDFDPQKIQDIVSNLVSNALKYTPSGGTIQILCQLESTQEIKISVRDTGIGIEQDKLPYIFDRFYQVDDSTIRQGEGTGIGLALTRELVKLLGGDIRVQSIPGTGSEFTVLLPIHQRTPIIPDLHQQVKPNRSSLDPIMTESISPAEKPDNYPKILIIEDNEDVVQYIRSFLQEKYLIYAASHGQEGINKTLEITPDLIISDVMMPGMDGYEVCQNLKQDTRSSHIPIILLTARADLASKLEGLQYGADVYLIKPFLRDELLVRIQTLLTRNERLQAHYRKLFGVSTFIEPGESELQISAPESKFVNKVREIINKHMSDSSFGVDQLCRLMAMSNSQLYRKLTSQTGLSGQELIQSIRLSKAKELLKNTDDNISEIAYDCGFNDPNYFTRVFKYEFGIPPSEFRSHSQDGLN